MRRKNKVKRPDVIKRNCIVSHCSLRKRAAVKREMLKNSVAVWTLNTELLVDKLVIVLQPLKFTSKFEKLVWRIFLEKSLSSGTEIQINFFINKKFVMKGSFLGVFSITKETKILPSKYCVYTDTIGRPLLFQQPGLSSNVSALFRDIDT